MRGNREDTLREYVNTSLLTRRDWLATLAAGIAVSVLPRRAWSVDSSPHARRSSPLLVYRSPSCGCCGKWIGIMRKSGFDITERNMEDVAPIKRQHHVPEELYSCHTAISGDYVFEGHVPPDLVQRVLRDKPAFLGLSAPGMPQSAPGMDIGHTPYEVISFTRTGKTAVYAKR